MLVGSYAAAARPLVKTVMTFLGMNLAAALVMGAPAVLETGFLGFLLVMLHTAHDMAALRVMCFMSMGHYSGSLC